MRSSGADRGEDVTCTRCRKRGIRNLANHADFCRGRKATRPKPRATKKRETRSTLRCQYCGERCNIVFDHLRPKSQGGRTQWGNMVYACRKCNEKKGGRTPKQAGMRLRGKPITQPKSPTVKKR